MRRASILEDRKARLADRAAHAEKVRLRAALAKAATRSTSNSEERALAAAQAREKNLAEIVANCAEEVKRAKGIAETMKEKREAEGIRLRKDMEERLAEAERRREEFLNKSSTKRSRSLSQLRKEASPLPEKEKINEMTAAARIQQKWRVYRRWKAVKEFADLGLTIEDVRETSFEQVTELLAQEKVLIATADILRICGLKEGESRSVNEMTAVRSFLSAFLILGHPTQVLSSKGDASNQAQVGSVPMQRDDLANPQLQDLVAKARDLLICFETVLSRLTTANNYTPPPAQLSTLSEVYATFYNAFIAWKARDSNTLIDMMVLQFVELDSIWQTVKDSTEDAVTESYRDGIRENQLKLMVRVKKLAGATQGKRLITNAIREARKARAAKKPFGDSKPRAAEAEPTSPVIDELEASHHAVESHLQPLTPPATPRRDYSHAEELRTAGSILPDNRIVVHELAINKEYRIQIDDCTNSRRTMTRIIFDSMRGEVAAGNSEPWVLAMAENVRGKLLRLLQPGNSVYTLIDQALDPELVCRELHTGGFSYEKFFSFMGSILPRLCAPVRDAEVKVLVEHTLQNGDFVDRLQALMHFVDLMQLDYANFMLQHSAPALIKEAIPYETRHFAKILSQTNNDVNLTAAAWQEARSKVLAEASKRDPENIDLPRNRPTPEKIYTQMLIDVFASVSSPPVPIPETLELDTKRIHRIRGDVLRIITTSAILLQCKNLLKRDVRSQWKTEASRIFSVLESDKLNAEQAAQGIQAALESSRSMPVATRNHILEMVSRIISSYHTFSTASTSPTPPVQTPLSPSASPSPPSHPRAQAHELRDPVLRLLLNRLRSHMAARLSAMSGTEKEKVRAQSTAMENLAGLGMAEFVPRVGEMIVEIGRVGRLDRDAHGVVYEGLII